jgi:site-specific recombinase XerD
MTVRHSCVCVKTCVSLLGMVRLVVLVYVRHRSLCPHVDRGEFYRGCNCAKWLRYSRGGKQHRVTARTRTWGIAEEKAADLQKKLDAGEAGKIPEIPETSQPTIEQAVVTLITAKESENVGKATIRKLKFQLGQFQRFMSERSKIYPTEITPTDLIEYRATWGGWKSAVTRQKAQQNLRGFLRSCVKTNLPALLDVLKQIRLTKTDRDRLTPQPFSEKELKHLLASVPKTFPDLAKSNRVIALIHCMVSTGLAIRDTVQLRPGDIHDGWLRIKRQKTARPVVQNLDINLIQEMLSVANEDYFFWDGTGAVTSAVGMWQADLRQLMQDAGLWIKGNLSHRFRDTAVDYWLGQGSSMTEIAAMLGDTVAVTEKHYADLASKRMESRLLKVPARDWSKE